MTFFQYRIIVAWLR